MYSQRAQDFIGEKAGTGDIEEKSAYKALRDDVEARLLIYFHGNTATVAQDRRTQEYRMYSSGASEKIFVLAFDYRGFGKSTGDPCESGLLKDAEAVIDWALNTVGISSDRIVLLGHSLGTAVASAIFHQYSSLDTPVKFAGLILCAAFTNAGNAFSAYAIGGVIPVLAPVKLIPSLQSWFSHRMRDTWRTDQRLAALAKCKSLNLVLVHAEDDGTMPWDQTEQLFHSTLKSATDGMPPVLKTVDLGEAGKQEIWSDGARRVSKLVAKHGGVYTTSQLCPLHLLTQNTLDHNTMMTWCPVSLAVLEMFGLAAITGATTQNP